MWYPEEDVKKILSELPSECSYLDYKEIPYLKNKKHDFIKDVIAMLNSPESIGEKKYIVFGVTDDKHRVGIDENMQPDDNEFQNWADNITPRPQIQTGTLKFKDKIFGYVYLLSSNEYVVHEVKNTVSGEKNYKAAGKYVVLQGQSFLRRGSRNEIMMQADRVRIYEYKKQDKVQILSPTIIPPKCGLLNAVALIGAWDEKREGDCKVIERIYGKEYALFQAELRAYYSNNQELISFSNKVWMTNSRNQILDSIANNVYDDQIDILKEVTLDIVLSTDPFLGLYVSEETGLSYSDLVNADAKYIYSDILRKNVFEFWAYAGNKSELFELLSKNKIKICIRDIIEAILKTKNWKIVMTNSKMLPMLAEAFPEAFLQEIEEAIKNEENVIHTVFKMDKDTHSREFAYSLGAALGLLATYKDYFSKAGLCLIALSGICDVFLDKISMIMLPWYPQTEAEASVRKGLLKAAFMDYPDNAWSLILNLLPNQKTSSYPIEKAEYMAAANIGADGASKKDYRDEIVGLVSLACSQAKNNPKRLIDLIPIMDDVGEDSRIEILSILSQESSSFTDSFTYQLWMKLSDFICHHKCYSDAEWALPGEQLLPIEKVALEYEKVVWLPNERRLFRNDQWELLDDKDNYIESEHKIRQEQINAAKKIYDLEEKQYIKFLDTIENAKLFGMCMANVEVSEDIWEVVLEMYISNEQRYIDFAISFIQESYYNNSEFLMGYLSKQNPEKAAHIYEILPITHEAINVIEKVDTELQRRYWERVEIGGFQTDDTIIRDYVIRKLLEYGRTNDLFRILYAEIKINKVSIPVEIVADALLKSTVDKDEKIDTYITESLINFVEESDIDEKQKVLVEWKYLNLLTRDNVACTKAIYRQFNDSPSEFMRVFSLVHKGESDDEVQPFNACLYTLLNSWKTIPGIKADGTLDADYFNQWIIDVMKIAEEKKRKDSVEHYLGKLFFHAPSSPDGLFIDRSVAKILHSDQRGHMLNGYLVEAINSRGVCWVDESGSAEFKLEKEYREKAQLAEIEGFTRLADTLRSIARNYHDEALYNIEEAKKWRNDK